MATRTACWRVYPAPSSRVVPSKRGTYAGLIDEIPYLQDLGVSAVELLPVFAFDEQDGPPGLGNYWGHQPLSFFAPHDGTRSDPLGALDEFRDMVKALHCAGIEVILDVVYNHTTEGNQDGPTICFRGLANETYYILAEDKGSIVTMLSTARVERPTAGSGTSANRWRGTNDSFPSVDAPLCGKRKLQDCWSRVVGCSHLSGL